MKLVTRFFDVLSKEGLGAATSKTLQFSANSISPQSTPSKVQLIEFYENILGKEQGFGLKLTDQNIPKGSMTWVIPDFTASSGGHINIFRMMRLLKDRGFEEQRVVIVDPYRWGSSEDAQKEMEAAFGEFGAKVFLGAESLEPCDYLIATGWQTAYWVAKYKDARHKLYFVQDFEPYFYANGGEYALAENTYRLGLTGITAGSWLAEKLESEYGMKTFGYSFACDLDHYKPTPKRESTNKNILFYARPVTPRRCFEVGLLALNKVCEEIPDAAVIFAGWDVSSYEIPFHHLNAGVLSLDQLPDLYSQCDAALVLSATNLSLLPLELAACKCPIVMNDGHNAEWLLDKKEAFYTPMDPDRIAETLIKVLKNKGGVATKVAKAAHKRANSQGWEEEADKVAEFIKALPQTK